MINIIRIKCYRYKNTFTGNRKINKIELTAENISLTVMCIHVSMLTYNGNRDICIMYFTLIHWLLLIKRTLTYIISFIVRLTLKTHVYLLPSRRYMIHIKHKHKKFVYFFTLYLLKKSILHTNIINRKICKYGCRIVRATYLYLQKRFWKLFS